MATFNTNWYEIDTEHFETAADVSEWIGNVNEEADTLCVNCKKGYSCQDLDRTPEGYTHCIHRDEFDGLMAVVDALIPYGVALAAARAA